MKRYVLLMFLVSFLVSGLYSKEKWEVGIHYSYWSFNVAKSFFEDSFTPDFEDYDPDKGSLGFNSDGNNYGIEIRFFPGGKKGSFSIGISYERNYFNLDFSGEYNDINDDGNPYEASASGSLELAPHSFNIGIRWELWPGSSIHPFIGIGLGAGLLNGTVKYQTETITYVPGNTEVEVTDDEMTLKEFLEELEDDGDGFPLSFFPIIHIHLGVRGEITQNLYLLAEMSVYDGIMFRGGIAYRF